MREYFVKHVVGYMAKLHPLMISASSKLKIFIVI